MEYKRSAEVIASLPDKVGLMLIDQAARVCRGSKGDNYQKMIPSLIRRGHESPLEHYNITIHVVTSRDVMCEMTRHRCGLSFSVESQRAVIDLGICLPVEAPPDKFRSCIDQVYRTYYELIQNGWRIEQARAVLPNCAATNIIVTGNCRAWRHFFALRTASDAYPPMRETAQLMLDAIKTSLPETYKMLFEEYCK
jgi:thymidylate synthase (FAD)